MDEAVKLNELAQEIYDDIAFSEREILGGYVIGDRQFAMGLKVVREIVKEVNPIDGSDSEFKKISDGIKAFIDMSTKDYQMLDRNFSDGIERGILIVDGHNPSNVKVYRY